MKASDRDLLVLVKGEFTNDQFMEEELEQLNNLLFHYETVDNFCIAHEVFDVSKYKIVTKAKKIQKILKQKQSKPFQFICNKN
jgi:F0F1-type ATP synthase alpha subunit